MCYNYKTQRLDVTCKLDLVYSKLYELTESEPDEELREYNEYLLDSIQEAIGYIQKLEKKVPRKQYSEETITRLNKKIQEEYIETVKQAIL